MAAEERDSLLLSIATGVADYEVVPITPEHVDRWVTQFDADGAVQTAILAELVHVLRNNYISRQTVSDLLEELLWGFPADDEDPRGFWSSVNFLRLGGTGRSQDTMLREFDALLQEHLALALADCGQPDGPYIYLDDVLHNGSQIIRNVGGWLRSSCAPAGANVLIVLLASHTSGQFYADGELTRDARPKGVEISWHPRVRIENRMMYRDRSEVLWPVAIPDDEATTAYARELTRVGYPPAYRQVWGANCTPWFRSEAGRQMLENHFVQVGARLTALCARPHRDMRPLGFTRLRNFGFGSLVLTYRNCPNTCPLALWWGGPTKPYPLNQWYPLFPRREQI